MDEINKKLDILINSISEMKTDIAATKELLNKQIDNHNKLEIEIKYIEQKINKQEEDNRSSNIILYNVKELEKNREQLYDNINNILKTAEIDIPDICIIKIQRLGKKVENKTRPILIKFIAERWKHVIFNKSTNIKIQGIEVSSDLSKENRINRGKMLKARYILKQEGKNPQLHGTQLTLDKHKFTMEEIEMIIKSDVHRHEKEVAETYNTDEDEFNTDLSQASNKNSRYEAPMLRSQVNKTNGKTSSITSQFRNKRTNK